MSTRSNPPRQTARKSTATPVNDDESRPSPLRSNNAFERVTARLGRSIERSRRVLDYHGPQGLGIGKGAIRRIRRHIVRRERQVVPRIRCIENAAVQVGKSIPCASFLRMVRQITQEFQTESGTIKWQMAALGILKDSVETYLVNQFESAYLFTTFSGRVTLMPKDFAMLQQVRNTEFSKHVAGFEFNNIRGAN